LLCSWGRAAGKGSERIQIDTAFTFRVEICIEEINVALFIVGIVGDILGLVAIENFKRTYVAGRQRIDSPKLRILLPRSVSIISAAAKNRRMAASPCVISS
jgi:hypothetical protein